MYTESCNIEGQVVVFLAHGRLTPFSVQILHNPMFTIVWCPAFAHGFFGTQNGFYWGVMKDCILNPAGLAIIRIILNMIMCAFGLTDLKLNFTATWGDMHYLGLTGLDVLNPEGDAIPLNISMIDAKPRDLNHLPGYGTDDRTLDKSVLFSCQSGPNFMVLADS